MTDKELIEQLKTENAALKARQAKAQRITMKVSEKGGLSIYGLGRFPVTLYKEQWLRLLDLAEAIRAFIAENGAALKAKGDEPTVPAPAATPAAPATMVRKAS